MSTDASELIPLRVTDIDKDGWIYNVDDGEIVGHIEADEQFQIDSTDKAEWALQLRSKIEGELAGLNAREQALIAQIKAIREAKMRLLRWWDWRFAADLTRFARSMLEGKKERTLRLIWGSISFRKKKGTNRIEDMDRAVAWMERWDSERIKVKTERTVSVKDVLEIRDYVARAFGDDADEAHPDWLKSSGEGENVTIDTGIQIEGK